MFSNIGAINSTVNPLKNCWESISLIVSGAVAAQIVNKVLNSPAAINLGIKLLIKAILFFHFSSLNFPNKTRVEVHQFYAYQRFFASVLNCLSAHHLL